MLAALDTHEPYLKNLQLAQAKCEGCFAPTDPVQDIVLPFRAAWIIVCAAFVLLAGACFCCRPARSASRTVGRTERTERTDRTDRTGLRGGLQRIDSDGTNASCRMASCFCLHMLGHMLAHRRSVCFAMSCFATSCCDQVMHGESMQPCLDVLCVTMHCFAVLCFAMPCGALLCHALRCYTLLC